MSLRIEQDGRLRRITMAAVERRNFLDAAMSRNLLRELRDGVADDGVGGPGQRMGIGEFGLALGAEIARAVRQRHLEWAINFAESCPDPTGPAKQGPEVIAEEHNLRSAVAWALDAADEESALRIIGSVWFGHFNERVALYERVLPPSPAVPAALAAEALV